MACHWSLVGARYPLLLLHSLAVVLEVVAVAAAAVVVVAAVPFEPQMGHILPTVVTVGLALGWKGARPRSGE